MPKPAIELMVVPADLETPISAALKLGVPTTPYSFLFESVEDGERRGHYSVIGLAPDIIWQRSASGAVEITQKGKTRTETRDLARLTPARLSPLDSLRALIQASQFDLPSHLPSIAAGIYGYMSYDMVRLLEDLPPPNTDALNVPDSIYVRPSRLVLFDNAKDEMTLIALSYDGQDSAASLREGLVQLKQTLAQPLLTEEPPSKLPPAAHSPTTSNMTQDEFYAAVDRTIDYIRAGDIYQAVISQRFETPLPFPPFSFYRALRSVNPSPYLFFMNFDAFFIAGSSPEILVRLEKNKITLRPIAGTTLRPEAGSNEDESTAAANLLADPKERAEHLMLLDLGRNDVGRVAKVGSVKVAEQFALQWTSHLIHIVSNVEGTLDPKFDALDAMLAGFPAGTVTGAPKIRAMEIIDELEKEKRSIYAGALGYFSANGDMDTCITLRTGVIKNETLYVQTGGGIVADSTPAYEYQESVNKAKALHRAVERTHEFAPLPSPKPSP